MRLRTDGSPDSIVVQGMQFVVVAAYLIVRKSVAGSGVVRIRCIPVGNMVYTVVVIRPRVYWLQWGVSCLDL